MHVYLPAFNIGKYLFPMIKSSSWLLYVKGGLYYRDLISILEIDVRAVLSAYATSVWLVIKVYSEELRGLPDVCTVFKFT